MSKYTEFTYPSRDGINEIHAYRWEPDTMEPKAIIQIIHGMTEYSKRYTEFANFLTEKGFIVVMEDHLGHGFTAKTRDDWGYFCKQDAATVLVRDSHRLKKITQEKFPGLKYFILGHSMGSFIFRKYLTMYGKGIDGAVVMGTGYMPWIVTKTGMTLAKFIGLFKGERYRSPLITKIAFGSYNKKIKDCKYPCEWITHREDILTAYAADELCTFTFTLNGYHTLFNLLHYDCRFKNVKKIPKDLPILMVSGLEDPVGNYGKGVTAVYSQYKKYGISDLTLKLYPNMRHEILNEIDNNVPYEDIYGWIEKRL